MTNKTKCQEEDSAKAKTPCLPGIRNFYLEKSNMTEKESSSSDSETEQVLRQKSLVCVNSKYNL